MRTGRHASIPETAADLREVWAAARPLDDATRPVWLAPEDDDGDFRHAGSVSLAGLDDLARAAAMAEFNELEYARLVVEEDPRRSDVHTTSMSANRGPSPSGASASARVRPRGVSPPRTTTPRCSPPSR